MKIYINFLIAGLISSFMVGCATDSVKVEKTQLQIREFQTRSYDTLDFKMVMKSVMNTLQDDGYIVKQANVDLGLLTATKEVDTTNKTAETLGILSSALGGSNNARFERNTIIEASANISQYGKTVKVRVNFITKKMNNRNEVMSVVQNDDQVFYQTFFSKVDKGIFLGKEGL